MEAKNQKKAWVPGTEPYSKQNKAEALKALREKLEAVTGKKATEGEVNLNTVLYEIATMFKLNDSQIEIALGKEGVAAIQAKLADAIWH